MTPKTQKKPPKPNLGAPETVVGIGASAGGLDVCRELLSKLPSEAGVAVVLVVHLHPDHESVMAELLAKDSSMPVEQASDGPILPNRVYVVPPNVTLALVAGSIKLTPLKKGDRLTRIDSFLRSLAADQGESAVGMILTGMGSDGTLGLRAIKDAGGITIVQDPDTAEHDEMPRSAIADGSVDGILPIDAIPGFLSQHVERLRAVKLNPPEQEENIVASLRGICHLLSRELQHDFSQYKQSTLLRRVRRRMVVLGVGSLKEYAALLDSNSGEAQKLQRELMVSVTRFFRDPDCFEALVPIIRQLVERSGDSGLRIWVPACATGEEAYSLAILVAEEFARVGRPPLAQIFATEIDKAALHCARKGCYAEGIRNDVGAVRLERFFTLRGERYEVKKELRAMCLFSQHNVISDPPFARIDLVSCRNLLIYFDAALQERIMETFHYSLNSAGYLLLGSAESAGQQGLFRTVDKTRRIHQSQNAPRSKSASRFTRTAYSGLAKDRREAPYSAPGLDIRSAFTRFVLPKLKTTVVTIDREDRVFDMCGNPGRYMTVQSGQIVDNLFALTRAELTSTLRTVLGKARREKGEAVLLGAAVPGVVGPDIRLDIRVYPYPSEPDAPTDYWVVVFQESEAEGATQSVDPAHGSDPTVERLQSELDSLHQHLAVVKAELETHIEDLHSSNEEMVVMNEEFQVANEELETSREEIQSSNQELLALNCELQESGADRDQAHSDLVNLFSSSPNPTIFLDRDLNIRQFTASSTEVYHLLPSDEGRPLAHVASRFSPLDISTHCEEVLRTLEPFATTVFRPAPDRPEAHYKLRILPYRSLDGAVEGIVLSFTDITDAEQANAQAQKRARLVAAVARMGALAARGESLDRFSQQALEEISEVLSMEVASFHRLLPDTAELELVAGRHWEGDHRMPLAGNSTVGHALLAGESITFSDLDGAGQTGDSPLLVQQGLCSGLTSVVLHEGHPYGVLGAYGRKRREFTADEVGFLESMAGLLGTGLAHHQDSFLRALEKVVTSTLATSADLLEALAGELGASVCELWLVENGSEQLTCTAVKQVSDGITTRSGVDMIGKVWRDKEPVWVVDLHTSSLFFASAEAKKLGLMSGFAVPLLSGGVAIGVLSCFFPVRHSSSKRLIAALKAAGSAIGEFLRRTQAESALQINEDRLHQALQTVPFPLCIIVETGELLLVSDATYELTGLPRGSLRTLSEWAEGPLRQPALSREILLALEDTAELPDIRQRSTHSVWTATGEQLLWDCTVASLGRSINGKRMLTAVAFDVTERELAREALEESSANKDDFLAMLGHELRNPLAGIRNGVQLLKMADDLAETAEAVGVVDRQSFQMTCLIDGLLDISRISRGKVSLDPNPLNLSRLAATLVADRSAGFTANGLTLRFVPGPSPCWVNGDHVRLLQVMDNLLSNSLKFTGPGGTVTLSIGTQGDDVLLSVKDTGIGMTPELAAVVFEPFRQGPQTLSRSQGGLGLGLSVVKLIVELHEGSVEVSSEGPLLGTEIRLTLPACPPGSEEVPAELQPVEPWSILVVEDNGDFGRSLTHLLRGAGHSVRRCADAETALVLLAAQTPEVILCDLGLPDGVDGFELIKRIRSLPQLRDVPVMAMTGYGLAEDRARSKAAGFVAHLSKPFDLEAVHRCLRSLPRPERTEARPEVESEPKRLLALSRVLVVDDNAMIAGSIAKMLTKVGLQALFACSAADALILAKDLRPQVALLDLGLPDRDGYQLKDDLAEMPECQSCLFLAVTGSDAPEDKERTQQAGFVAHLTKPVSLEELVYQIDQAGKQWTREFALG